MTVTITFNHSRTPEGLVEFQTQLEAWVRAQSRIEDVEFEWSDLPSDVTMGTFLRLLWGYLEANPNGLSVVSTIRPAEGVGDPSELRLASNSPEPTLGHSSGNSLREDGRQEMVAFELYKRWEVMRRLGARNLFGAREQWVRDPSRSTIDDQQFVKRQSWEPDGTRIYGALHLTGPVYLNGQVIIPEPFAGVAADAGGYDDAAPQKLPAGVTIVTDERT